MSSLAPSRGLPNLSSQRLPAPQSTSPLPPARPQQQLHATSTPSPFGSDSEESDNSTPSSPTNSADDDEEAFPSPASSTPSSGRATPQQQEQQEAQDEDTVPTISSLPSRHLIRGPRSIADRKQGKPSLAASLQRKRADESKWARYETMTPFTIELDLSPEELSRR